MAQAVSFREVKGVEGPIAKAFVKQEEDELFMVATDAAGAVEASDLGSTEIVLSAWQEVWEKGCAGYGDYEPLAQALGIGKRVEAAVARAGCFAKGLARTEPVP